MTRPLLIAGAGLSLAFALLVGGLRLQAGDGMANAFFGDCVAPCWQQLQPGVASRADALALLKPRGWSFDAECNSAVYDVCYIFADEQSERTANVFIAGDQVKQIALLDSGIALGDIWLMYGPPDYAAIPPARASTVTFFTALWFGNAGISARLSIPCPARYPDVLRAPIRTILVWERGTAMRGDTIGSVGDLRQMLRRICSV